MTSATRRQAALRIRGTTLAAIARDIKVSAASVSMVSQGRGRSARIEQAIAERLGMQAPELWPERYSQQSKEASR